MNEHWSIIIAVPLGALAVLAELNLVRVFIGDWREGRRGARRMKPTSVRVGRATARVRGSARNGWPRAIAAAALGAAIPAVAAGADFLSMPLRSTFDDRTGDRQPVEGGSAFSKQQGDLSTPLDTAAPEAKPLTISTDRPGFSDSSGISAVGHLQLETGYTFTFRNRDGVETQTHNAPELLGRVGIIDDRLELRVGTSGYLWSRSDDGSGGGFSSVEGFSDLFAGFKLKCLDQDGGVPRVAFEAITTTSTGSRGVSNRDLEPTLKLIPSWDLGSGFTLTTNAVVTYATSGSDRFVQGAGSASLAYATTDKLSLFAEYFVGGPRTKGSDAAHSIDFGGAYLINNRVQIDGRVGFGLNQEADNVFVGVGVSFLF